MPTIEVRSYADWHHEVVEVREDGDWPVAVCECFDDALDVAAGAGMHPLAVMAHRIARHTAAGIFDPTSLSKLETEEQELAEALHRSDSADCLTELADVAYYAGKCMVNGLLSEEEAEARVRAAARAALPDLRGAAIDLASALAEAKYAARRMAGRKDPAGERAACAQAARAWRRLA